MFLFPSRAHNYATINCFHNKVNDFANSGRTNRRNNTVTEQIFGEMKTSTMNISNFDTFTPNRLHNIRQSNSLSSIEMMTERNCTAIFAYIYRTFVLVKTNMYIVQMYIAKLSKIFIDTSQKSCVQKIRHRNCEV